MSSNTLKKALVPILFIIMATLVACYYIITEYNAQKREAAKAASAQATEEKADNTEDIVDLNELSYECTGTLINKDSDNGTITIQPVEGGDDFLLKYDGTTKFLAKHGNGITVGQLNLGEIVDVTYSVHSGKLKSVQISDKAWTMTDVTKFEIDEKKKSMTIGDETFRIGKDLVVSYGDTLEKIMDVTQLDSLIVKGCDRKVLSITVDRGHGYLRLVNDSYFVGGWIEIGQEIIKPVTSEMLVPVPEGTYHVKVTNKGYAGQEDVVIERDKEAVLDLAKVDIEEIAIGHIEFKINPDFAQLTVDGEMTEFTERVPLEYGVHKVHVEMAGYKSVDTSIKVASEYANVEITLEKEDEDTQDSATNMLPPSSSQSTMASDNTSSSSTDTSQVVISGTHQIYVEAPEGAEVYLDGNYIGIVPAHTDKVTGQHVLTLSKSGYTTKSYTIMVDTKDMDVTFSFSDLIANSQTE